MHAKWFSYVIKSLTFSFFVDKWGPHIWWDIFIANISGFLIYLIVSFSSTAVHVAQQETDLSHRCIARKIFNILHMAEPCQQIPKCFLENSSEWWRLPADLELSPMELLGVTLFTLDTEDKYLQLVFQLCHDRIRVTAKTITYFYTLTLNDFLFSFKEKGKRVWAWMLWVGHGKRTSVSPTLMGVWVGSGMRFKEIIRLIIEW